MDNQLTVSSSSIVRCADSFAELRHRIRTPIYQIISYVEIILEDEHARDKVLSDYLSQTLAVCEQALRVTQAMAENEGLEGAFKARHEMLLECSAGILEKAQQLHGLFSAEASSALLEASPALRKDADKIQRIATTFFALVRTLESPSPVAAVSSSQRGAVATAANPKAEPSTNGVPQQRGLILVVDDDEGNRDVLSRRLLRDGCDVMLAEGGHQALRMLKRYGFDLVMLDVMMPEMDGFAVLEEIRKCPELVDLPVIMITAVDEVESVVRSIELGADDYLLKPFNPVLLRARVRALLERKRLRDEQERKKRELEESLLEIDRQRRRTDELLQNILPSSVAQELQQNGFVQPMYFEDVTIVFADIVGFTRSIEDLSAEELVAVLHNYFSAFDTIVARFGLEKLKTIGDCYMFCGGLPERCPSHPVDSVLAAVYMLHAMQELAKANLVKWDLRVGIHTGPVIAGVVGLRKFAFDIWGDAVNFSSRVESSGVTGRINMSSSTYGRVKDFFKCEKREKIRIKDGREVETYLIAGIAERLASNTSCSPREAFEQRYRTYFRRQLPDFPQTLVEKTEAE